MDSNATGELREYSANAQHCSLREALGHATSIAPDAPAIYQESGNCLRYGHLCEQIDYVQRELQVHGISQTDCVAVILPQSVDLAVALLGVACAARAAPLNSEYTIDEIRLYLATLKAKAVVALSGSIGEAAATDLGIPVLIVVPDPDRSPGLFRFANQRNGGARESPGPTVNDICAIFLTSGTTSRPKRVPLTHGMVLARAKRTIDGFRLTTEDRLLDPMAQTSAYSLVSALLPALLSGGSATILDQFEPIRFFRRVHEFSATWTVAAPPHLQAILLALEHQPERFERQSLRVIRSGTGRLPEDVANRLEAHLGIPIAVGYGTVESGQIANSPAPPERRKPGSVGRPRMEIKLLDVNGRRVEAREHGEILVRDPQVFTGYIDDPQATESAFDDGWLCTGDLGYMDEDGFLFLVGRIKEMINRGGQSIAPMEIDDALLSHPAVAEAAAFPIPHRSLQEDIAAAVKLKPEAEVAERDLIQHVAALLSVTKAPRKIYILSDLPKAPSGKVSRRLLSEEFSEIASQEATPGGATRQQRARLVPDSPCVPPITPVEKQLASIWAEVLDLDEVGVHDGFMDLGGDSLTATQIISRMQDEFDSNLSVRLLFEASTIAELARCITRTPPVPTL